MVVHHGGLPLDFHMYPQRGPCLLDSGLSQIIKSVVFVTSRKVDLFNKAEVLKIDLDFCVTVRSCCTISVTDLLDLVPIRAW